MSHPRAASRRIAISLSAALISAASLFATTSTTKTFPDAEASDLAKRDQLRLAGRESSVDLGSILRGHLHRRNCGDASWESSLPAIDALAQHLFRLP